LFHTGARNVLYAIGGANLTTVVATVEAYNPATKKVKAADRRHERHWFCVVPAAREART
jgi:hypothetical protein